MTMGTASTMACMVEALGLTLPGAAAIPAVDSRKKVMAQLSGRRIVEMVKENLKISKILTRKAFENSISGKCRYRWFYQFDHSPVGHCGKNWCRVKP